jgi:CHAT domain-containing protein
MFVVSATKLSIVRSATNQRALAQRIRLLDDLWGAARQDWQIGLTVSSALHDELIEPVARLGVLNGVARLVVIPHGGLAQVPFAALMDSRSRRFLVQDFSLVQSPSAAAFVALRMRGRSGNPSGSGVEVFAPFPDELPGTAREAQAIRRSVPKTRSHVGRASTEARLRNSLRRGDIVHVATHGILNFRNPMFSGIELWRDGRAGPMDRAADDDGRLEVRELLALDVFSPLVFLSGCETGASDKVGESGIVNTGDLNLSQAFLSAGALNVVSSIWRIDDAGAARFAELFHARLRSTSPGDALAFAQRSLARGKGYGNPYYWAGYVLSGEGRSAISQRIARAAVK